MAPRDWLLGVDLGGTKIECAAVGSDGRILARQRLPTPRGDYEATLLAIARCVQAVEASCGAPGARRRPVGVAIPGSASPHDGRIRNANSEVLNGRPLRRDLEQRLDRPVRLCNDANALAVSECAADGAAAGCDPVFAVILGTGVGGGVACGGGVLEGANGLAGEWGHNPLPWLRLAPAWGEAPGPRCWCGRHACLETFVSGPALAADYAAHAAGAQAEDAARVIDAMRAGDGRARAAFVRYCDRLARGLAQVINLLDPQVIVLGGGMSNVDELYAEVAARWQAWVFSPQPVRTRLLRARHGDSSGVRGAAWLWREPVAAD